MEVLAPHSLPDLVQVLQDVGTVAAEPPPTDGPLPGRACSASLMCQLTSKRGAKGTLRPLDALLVAQVRQTARPILPAPVRFLYRVHSPVNRGSRRTQPHRCHHPRRNQGLITPPPPTDRPPNGLTTASTDPLVRLFSVLHMPYPAPLSENSPQRGPVELSFGESPRITGCPEVSKKCPTRSRPAGTARFHRERYLRTTVEMTGF